MTLDLTKPYPHLAQNMVYHLNQFEWVTLNNQLDLFIPYDQQLTASIQVYDVHEIWSWYDVGQALLKLNEVDAFQLRHRLLKIDDELTQGLHDILVDGTTSNRQFGAHYPPRVHPSQLYNILKQAYIASVLPPDRLAELLKTDDVDSFKVFLNTGEFDVTIHSSDRSNLLHGVAQYNAVLIGHYLLENYDLSHRARNDNHMTPLMTAVHRGHVEIARLLVEYGSPILLKPHRSMNLLDLAYFSLNDEMVEYVKSIAPSLTSPRLTYREILYWMDSQHEERIITAVQSGELGIIVTNERGQKVHLLTLAISYYLIRVVQFLIEHYPIINEPLDEDGVLPIMVAVRYKNTTLIDYLLEKGAHFDLNLPPMTAAAMVLEHLGVESFFHYLSKGLVLHDHETSIGYYASYHGSLPLIQWYHEQGYDLNDVLPDGISFLTNAIMRQHHDIVQYLIAKSDAQLLNLRLSPIVGYAVEHGSLALVQQLVQQGFSIEIPVRQLRGYRPLHLAIFRHKNDIATYLLQQGANVQKPAKSMVYALDLARQTRNTVMVKTLKTTYHAHGFFTWYLNFASILLLIVLSIFGITYLLETFLG